MSLLIPRLMNSHSCVNTPDVAVEGRRLSRLTHILSLGSNAPLMAAAVSAAALGIVPVYVTVTTLLSVGASLIYHGHHDYREEPTTSQNAVYGLDVTLAVTAAVAIGIWFVTSLMRIGPVPYGAMTVVICATIFGLVTFFIGGMLHDRNMVDESGTVHSVWHLLVAIVFVAAALSAQRRVISL